MSTSGPGVVPANGIRIAYETFGDRGDRPLLMVMGLGAPMLTRHPDVCKLLAGRGFVVIRYDNRDVGRSTHLHDAPEPDVRGARRRGDVSSAAYTLDDMAEDGFGLLDALGLTVAHVLGAPPSSSPAPSSWSCPAWVTTCPGPCGLPWPTP
jgi:pimeloyl-ACP methyl ester carboxylesterase